MRLTSICNYCNTHTEDTGNEWKHCAWPEWLSSFC